MKLVVLSLACAAALLACSGGAQPESGMAIASVAEPLQEPDGNDADRRRLSAAGSAALGAGFDGQDAGGEGRLTIAEPATQWTVTLGLAPSHTARFVTGDGAFTETYYPVDTLTRIGVTAALLKTHTDHPAHAAHPLWNASVSVSGHDRAKTLKLCAELVGPDCVLLGSGIRWWIPGEVTLTALSAGVYPPIR